MAVFLYRPVPTLLRVAGELMTALSRPVGAERLRRYIVMAVAVATAMGVLALAGVFGTQVASAAATAPAATQCDPPAFPTGAGYQVTCTITIDNTVTAAAASSSTVTATACLAAAGVTPPSGCTTTVTTSNQLVTSVDQCNGIVVGGGSNVTCDVSVVNYHSDRSSDIGCHRQSMHRFRHGRRYPADPPLRPGGEYDQCDCDAVQWLGERGRRQHQGAMRCDRFDHGRARHHKSVQRLF